jgi:hypothetical protein
MQEKLESLLSACLSETVVYLWCEVGESVLDFVRPSKNTDVSLFYNLLT